jgi:serine phosphatase RsbU (regulator of sigma subunit)
MSIEGSMLPPPRRISIIRAVLIVLSAILFGLTGVTFVNFASSPTDENLFSDPPARMTLVLEKAIPAEQVLESRTSDSRHFETRSAGIRPGDVLYRVNQHAALSPAELREALNKVPSDSSVLLEVYRPDPGAFIRYRALHSAIPDSAFIMVNRLIVVRDVAPGGASDRAGMRVGDLIVRINGQEFTNAQDADRILRRGQTGKRLAYDIFRDGKPIVLDVVLARFGIPPAILVMFISGLFMMIVGAFVSLKRPGITAARALGLSFLLLGYLTSVALIRKEPDENIYVLVRNALVAVSLLFGTAYAAWSSLHFPVEHTYLATRKWIVWVLFSTPVFFLILSAIFGNFFLWTGLGVILLFSIIVRFVFKKKATVERRGMRRVIKWTSIAVACIVAGSMSLIPLYGPDWGIGITGAALLAVPLSHLYVIARYRLLDLNLRVKRNVQYSVLSVVWGMALASILVWIFLELAEVRLHLPRIVVRGGLIEAVDDPRYAESGEWTNRMALMAAGVGLSYVLWKLRRTGQNLIDKKYFRTHYDYRRAVNELGEVLSTKLTMQDLGRGLVEKLAQLMHLRRAGVLFFGQASVSSCYEAFGIERDEWIAFCSPLEKDLQSALAGSTDWVHVDYLPPQMGAFFERHAFSLLVPVRSKGRLLGVMVLGEKLSEATYQAEDFEFLSAAVAQVTVAMENSFLYEELAEKERLKHELEIARQIQMESLPQKTPIVKGLDIAGISIPAMEVGGDFFDYLNGAADRLTIVVGDVSGKGTSAALYMAKVQGILRSLYGFDLSPGNLFIRANHLLCTDLEKRSFVTAVGAAFQPGEHTFVLARAGHLPLYHFHAIPGVVDKVVPRGLGLGLNNVGVFASEIEERVVRYAKGDVLLFVTDGVTEAQNHDGDMFGEERVSSFLRENGRATSTEIRDALLGEIREFMAGAAQHDDATIVVVKGT